MRNSAIINDKQKTSNLLGVKYSNYNPNNSTKREVRKTW